LPDTRAPRSDQDDRGAEPGRDEPEPQRTAEGDGTDQRLKSREGDLKIDLQDLGKKFLRNRFQLISLPFSEMPKAYRAADLFTLVSESYYSFEIAIVEALATNLPVVVNSDSIRKEIIRDTGILVNPTDISSYSEALDKALKTNWHEKPREVALDYDWNKISEMYEKLFFDLLKEEKK